MSSPHKIFFHTPTKKSIRNQFIKQENNKKKINERSQENISKSNIKEMSQKDYCKKNQIINVTRRSLTPQPSIAKHKYNYFDEDKSVINSQISKRSLTPNARYVFLPFANFTFI